MMKTFEEKILAYLDGSLSGADREEVRAQSQASPDRRALLDAHLRLQDLYALTAPAVSAPLAIQRELAAKIPMLAIKLPYLAAERERRDAAVIGFFDRMSGWAGSIRSSWVNTILFIVFALLLGGVWYVVNHSHQGVSSSASNNITSNNSTSNFSNGNGSGNGPTGGGPGNSPHNIPPSNSNGSNSSGPNTSGPSGPGVGGTSSSVMHASLRSDRVETRSTHHAHSTNSSVRHIREHLRASSVERVNTVAASHLPASDVLNDHTTPGEHAPGGLFPPPNSMASPPEFPPLELRAVAAWPQHPAMFQASHAIPLQLTRGGQEPSYNPFRVFVAEAVRMLRPTPQAHPSEFARSSPQSIWSTSVISENTEIGIDYEVTPWIAIGLRAGNARFIREQQVSHSERIVPGYPLTRTVTETALLDPFLIWAGPSATYSFNPGAPLDYSITAAAGDIFSGGFSPILLGEAAATYKFSYAFALRAAVSYDAEWVTSVSSPPATNSTSVSGATIASTANTLKPSQTLGFSLGVSFHP